MKCWMIGGQTTPESELPIVAKEMARPRCRSNHREASRTKGGNVAARRRRRARRGAAEKRDRVGGEAVGIQPTPIGIVPPANGGRMPKRPANRPAMMPPLMKPIIVSVYGREAPARCTPK